MTKKYTETIRIRWLVIVPSLLQAHTTCAALQVQLVIGNSTICDESLRSDQV